ncbi:cytochrome-c peroxidase [Cupriavidus sp. IDO]|uniref:cytochrome-c peroxidase n=1 Tax=Cupriavidus sp. IDO TaxID=1539142 RepID=UPI0006915D6B|nr:cytochrome c peroxidase [Cupriavidus sp. IDO]KWR82941.1 cytochrome-c peroxidase [Cupriavidus sp. IDO]
MSQLHKSWLPASRQASQRARLTGALAAVVVVLAPLALLIGFGRADGATDHLDSWSKEERAVLSSMSLNKLPAPPRDPSNAVADKPEAVALGKRLFADARLSSNGAVSCASCHAPDRQFQDSLPVGRGVGVGKRRTMPVAATAYSPFLFWDGRKDSQWSQALGPLEDSVEHGGNRVQFARVVRTHYQREYESLFGALPNLQDLPADASPLGSADEKRAWSRLTNAQRDAVNRVFANLGKAIAAYERTVTYGASRFDQYVEAVLIGERAGPQLLSTQEVNGLRLFIGKAQCATCHNGPLLTDQAFHNTGVPPREPARPDRGRAPATAKVLADEFNCLSRYSDAPAQACQELSFMVTDEPGMEGAFKTPSLRNVELRAPYMHAGQLATLDEVVTHYVHSPAAAMGHSELPLGGGGRAERKPIRLTEEEMRDVVAFLRSLSGPIMERPAR